MRQPVRQNRGRNQVSKSYTIPASIKGWLANEAISKMEETGAVVLDNFFPDPDAIRWRRGSQVFATTPETTAVETVMVWQGGANSNIFACTGGKIYDVTAGGTLALLPSPTNGALTQTAGGTLAATTYYVKSTWVNAIGETLPGAETSLAVLVNNVLNVAAPASPPTGATGWNVYVGAGSGSETKQNATPLGLAAAWVEPTSGLIAGSLPPTINTTATTQQGFSSNRWQSVNFSTPGGQFLVAVNGLDAPRNFNGTSWSTSPAITGPANPNLLIHVWPFKQRLFFVEFGTANVWYLAPNAIGGAATQLPLGSLLTKGGYIMAGATWTRDSGFGPQDYCVFISSEGEVLIYGGTDPSSTTTWSMVGRFQIGRPIGRRCWLNVGSDIVINCSDGLMPLSKAIQYDRAAAATAAFTWNIQSAFNSAYRSYGTNFGWQILSYPKTNMAIINVPIAGGLTSYQYVMNVLTGAWARFIGMNASSWVVRQDDLFFGDMQGRVIQAETGSADINQPIAASWVSAFNDLGRPGIQKNVRLMRPIFITDPGIQAAMGVCSDYNVVVPTVVQSAVASNASLWDQALWDQGTWAPDSTTKADWVNASGEGYQIAAAVGINMLSSTPTVGINCKIASATILYEPGGYI